jgi:shikimate kinase
MIAPGVRRVLLVGFMGSGKSTVGPLLAESLSWRFHDFDEGIEASEGMSVAEIFRQRGEEHFRSIEARIAAKLLLEEEVVLGSGGGWAAVPGRLDALPTGMVSVWLRVTAAEAIVRARADSGVRPLLAGADPDARAEALLAERAPRYARAHLSVDTTGRTPEDVTADILKLLERHGPGPKSRSPSGARRSEPWMETG